MRCYVVFSLLTQISVMYKSFSKEGNWVNGEQSVFDHRVLDTRQHEFKAYLEMFTSVTGFDLLSAVISSFLSICPSDNQHHRALTLPCDDAAFEKTSINS